MKSIEDDEDEESELLTNSSMVRGRAVHQNSTSGSCYSQPLAETDFMQAVPQQLQWTTSDLEPIKDSTSSTSPIEKKDETWLNRPVNVAMGCAQPKLEQEIFELQQLEQNPIGHQGLSKQRSDTDLDESSDVVTCEAALSDGIGISNVNAESEEVGDRDVINIQTASSQTEFEPSQRPTRDIRRPSRFQDEMIETRLPVLLRRPMSYFNSGREVPSSNDSHLLNATPSNEDQQSKPVRRDKKKRIRRICSGNRETEPNCQSTAFFVVHRKKYRIGRRLQFNRQHRHRLDWHGLHVHNLCTSQRIKSSVRRCFCLFRFKLCINTCLNRRLKSTSCKKRDQGPCVYNLPANMNEARQLLKSTNIIVGKNNVMRPHRTAVSTMDQTSVAVRNEPSATSFLVHEKPSGAHLHLKSAVRVQQASLNKVRKLYRLTDMECENNRQNQQRYEKWPHFSTYTRQWYTQSRLPTIFEDTASMNVAVTDISISQPHLSTMMSRTKTPAARDCTPATMQMRDQSSLQVRDQVQQNDGQIPGFELPSATAPEYNNVRDANTALHHKASEENENFDAFYNNYLRNGSTYTPAGDAVENEPRRETSRIKVSKENYSSENNALQEKLEISDARATATQNKVLPFPYDYSSQQKCFQRIADIREHCNQLFAYLINTSVNTVKYERYLDFVHNVLEFFTDETLPYRPVRPPDKFLQRREDVQQ